MADDAVKARLGAGFRVSVRRIDASFSGSQTKYALKNYRSPSTQQEISVLFPLFGYVCSLIGSLMGTFGCPSAGSRQSHRNFLKAALNWPSVLF